MCGSLSEGTPHPSFVGGEDMKTIKRFAIPLLTLLALAIASSASWRL